MQKTKFFTCLYHTVLFFCSKRCKIKFNTLFDYENKQLNRIAINPSEDIDYQDFKKIYRGCTKEPFNFLTIDTTLPARDILIFRKNLLDSYENDNN